MRKKQSTLRPRGVYLITGGLGKVGLALAECLTRQVQARLILVGRSDLPPKIQWNQVLAEASGESPISRKIASIMALEAAGAEVLVQKADVADLEQMRSVWLESEKIFGKIDGVIHAAGQPALATLPEINEEICAKQFQSKVYGLYVLEQLIAEKRVDFCCLISSLASVLGGLGYGPYAAANLFMDAFAIEQNQKGRTRTHWITINWDGWDFRTGADSSEGITAQEGMAAFIQALELNTLTEVIVSTKDLDERINQWIQLKPAHGRSPEDSLKLHKRPDLSSSYVEPRGEMEQTLVDIWKRLLGIEVIGIEDDFFELGGHSLLATQLVSRIRERFTVNLPLRDIFEHPTISKLGVQIQILAEQSKKSPISPTESADRAAKLKSEIDRLSPAEIEALLAKKRAAKEKRTYDNE